MRKLLTPGAIFMVVCIFFSSCSSNMSIAKRHYRGGYYVESVKRTQNVNPLKKDEVKTAQAKRNMPAYQIPDPPATNNTDKHVNRVSQTRDPIVTAAADEKVEHKIIRQETAKQMVEQNVTATENTFSQNQQTFSSSAQYHDDDAAGAALSLLWIVIVIILIIWLVGLVAGVGGLINLLLVVALILLILWLLRII